MLVKKMQPNAILSIGSPHFRIEVVKGTPIVFVDVVMLHQDRAYFGGDAPLEFIRNRLGREVGIKHLDELAVAFSPVD